MKPGKAWLFAVLAILLVPATAQAAGGVSGTVTAVGGEALEGISVCAREQSSFVPQCATTDAGGAYEIEILQTGKYRVKFEGGDDYVDRWFADAANEGEADVLSVSSSHLTEGVDAELPPAGQVEGTVTDAVTHAGIGGVSACARQEGSVFSAGCATTDGSGHYLLGGLPPGSYAVDFNAGSEPASRDYLGEYYDDIANAGEATPVEVTAGATSAAIDAKLEKGARISGTVTDEGGKPVAGVMVCAEVAKPRRNFGPCASSGADGTYTIHRVRSGNYRVGFFPGPFSGNYLDQYYDDQPSRKLAQTIAAAAPATVAGVDATLHPGGQIEGTITDGLTANPLQNARACAVEIGAEGGERCAQTSASGTYAIGSLPTGTFEVIFSGGPGNPGSASERYDSQPIDDSGTPVVVTAGATVTGIDGDLPRGGSVRGTVTAEVSGLPIESIEVCALRGHQAEGRCIFTDQLGNYEITGLDVGSYAIRFRPGTPFGPGAEPSDPDWITQWYSSQATRADAEPLEVVSGITFLGVDAEMVSGARISGTLTGAGGVPIPSGYSCAVPSGSGEERCGFAGEDGNYQIQGLAPGSYQVRFGANPANGGTGWLPEFWEDKPDAAAADEVEVLGGVTEEVDAELQSAGAISGRVTVAGSGAPLPEAFVCAIPDGETEAANCAEAGANGKYLIPLLPSGSYRVEFSVSYFEDGERLDEFETQFHAGASSLGGSAVVDVSAGSIAGSIDAAMVEVSSPPEPPDPEGGGQPPGDLPATPVPPPLAATPPATPEPAAKKPRCRKGFRAKKVRGKWRCARKKAKPRHQKGR